MFARTKTYKNQDGSSREYLEIVENRRVDGKVRQRVVGRLGRLDKIQQEGQLDKLVGSLAKFSTRQALIEAVPDALGAEWSHELGPVLVFCVFRTKSNTHSGPNRTLVSDQNLQAFRWKANTNQR